jgi:hypothetical protein
VSINYYERINKARWYNFVTGFNFDSSNDAELNQGYYTTEQLEQAFLNED